MASLTIPRSTPHLAPRPPKFDLRQARAFVLVAEELHFGRAAARLFMTQPALSRSIRSLEEAVGTVLFERSTRRVRLTAAGDAFAAECRLALGHLERASAAAMNAAEGREGRLRVGYMDFAINGRLPGILKAFSAKYPHVLVDLEYIPTALQHTALLQGRIDIGFVIGEFRAPRILNLHVDSDDFVALLPEGHRLAGRPSLRLADLADEPFVLGSEDTFSSFRQLLLPLCLNAGFYPRIVQQASNTSGIFGMVAAGVGVTLYAGCARNFRRSGVVVKALADVREKIPTYAACLADNPSEVLGRFRAFVV
ncbi:MAG: LysR family transcriptional regulator [Burkholderiales bacterium]